MSYYSKYNRNFYRKIVKDLNPIFYWQIYRNFNRVDIFMELLHSYRNLWVSIIIYFYIFYLERLYFILDSKYGLLNIFNSICQDRPREIIVIC